MSFNPLKILKSIAPTIASALPGPFGGLARSIVTEALGIDKTTSDDKIEAELAKNPELYEKLKRAEMDFQLKLEQLGLDAEKIAADDRSSARQREVALKDWTPRLLGGFVLAGWVGVTVTLLTLTIPPSNQDIVMRSLGTLDMAMGLVLSYYFGSSSGSREKTELLAKNGK